MTITPKEIAELVAFCEAEVDTRKHGGDDSSYVREARRALAIAMSLRAELACVTAERDALTYEAKDAKVLRSELFHVTAERDAALSRAERARREGIEEAYDAAEFWGCPGDALAAIRRLLDAPADGKKEGE